MKKLYVRVQPKKSVTKFFRCGFLFALAWQEVEVDNATAKRLEEEQMLEVSETKPVELEETEARDNAENTSGTANASGTNAAQNTGNSLKPDDQAEVALAIIAAIGQLNKEDVTLWTAGGKPKTEAIAVITGWPVTAAERDAALPVAE